MKQRNLLANLVLAGLGLLVMSSVLGSVSQDGNLVKASKDFNGFKVEVEAPSLAIAQHLLSAVPANLTDTADTATKISEAINQVRMKNYPDDAVSVDVIRPAEKNANKSTSSYVDAYRIFYLWNRVVGYNGQIYAYNYNVNTVVCVGRSQTGTWYGQYQSNGAWSNVGYIYTGGMQTMSSTGYDNRKGCNWWGKLNYNKGDFIIYFFD